MITNLHAITISRPDKLVVSIDGDVEDVSCNGDADGSIPAFLFQAEQVNI